jgi:N-acetylglucosaminyldiphosphoundecaprenol N-acetyl-beta-D-mannosaminyltransferase
LGIHIYDGSVNSFTKELIDDINSKKANNRLVSARDANGLVYANRKTAFKEILNQFYCNLPDGMPIVWIAKLKGFKKVERTTGFDTFTNVIKQTANTPIKHFFCGGKENIALKLKEATLAKFGNANIVGTYSPPFREMSSEEIAEIGQIINASGANIVWIGLGSPKQETFAANLAKHVNVNYIITIGAVFDFFTGNIKRAPSWLQNLGLEWLFRVIKEPRRLFRRYAIVVPIFIWLNFKELFKKII